MNAEKPTQIRATPPPERGKFPARLHVLLARDAKVGLVIRRGPSKSVCTVLWDRERDSFKLGQWMRGRIYERRSDLSPSGAHFIYFAMNGRWQSETKGSWNETTNKVLVFPEWEWAEFVDGRLVWASEGKLSAARLGRGALIGEKLLHNFNGMRFEAIAAPY